MLGPSSAVKPASCPTMRELRRTNDLVFLSYAEAVLRSAGLNPFVLDGAMSAADGSIGALPRRLVVPENEAEEALALLAALESGS